MYEVMVVAESLEAGYRSALQESALVVSLQMFNLILEKCVSLLKENMACEDNCGLQLVASEDLQVLLPAVKVSLQLHSITFYLMM
ncbi:hypothetical protein PR048_017445 [Dryococelus australis]|uniref:Uncharacterized protein n=1 Tax=Dryococelus australis TaxID=614101 RepID=A0ABQ9H9M4_9NEOP|nr:hypothetical protein PR048_017445 [Dryococelus australis]